jgi:hypothetical protein
MSVDKLTLSMLWMRRTWPTLTVGPVRETPTTAALDDDAAFRRTTRDEAGAILNMMNELLHRLKGGKKREWADSAGEGRC